MDQLLFALPIINDDDVEINFSFISSRYFKEASTNYILEK